VAKDERRLVGRDRPELAGLDLGVSTLTTLAWISTSPP
jgi:hypothetical protein